MMITINDLFQNADPQAINAVIQNDEGIAAGAISRAYAYVSARISTCTGENLVIDNDDALKLAVIKRALYELFIYSNDVVIAEQYKEDAENLIKARLGSCTVKEAAPAVVYLKEGREDWNGFK